MSNESVKHLVERTIEKTTTREVYAPPIIEPSHRPHGRRLRNPHRATNLPATRTYRAERGGLEYLLTTEERNGLPDACAKMLVELRTECAVP